MFLTFLGAFLSTSKTSVSAEGKILRHVVLFKFKDTATPAQIRQVEDAFSGAAGENQRGQDVRMGH
jgi:hypothetical protein